MRRPHADKLTIALLTSDSGRASRACTFAGSGTTLARPIITTSWRSRWMVRSNGPVSGPDDKPRRALALGFRAGRMQAGQRGADAILDPVQGVVVEPARQARQQFGERSSQQLEQAQPR